MFTRIIFSLRGKEFDTIKDGMLTENECLAHIKKIWCENQMLSYEYLNTNPDEQNNIRIHSGGEKGKATSTHITSNKGKDTVTRRRKN